MVTWVFYYEIMDSFDHVPTVSELEADLFLLIEHHLHDLARFRSYLSLLSNFLVGASVHAQLHVVLVFINFAGF
jgi:hypothetical protein